MLQIPAEKYSYSFQSRLGRDEWLKPYTAQRLTEFPAEGVKKLLIACPAFVSDCLETLEEIAGQGRESFLACWWRIAYPDSLFECASHVGEGDCQLDKR